MKEMKYRYPLFTALGFFLLILINSCELYNPAEPVPAYIHIDKFILQKNLAGFPNSVTNDEGSLSQKITDAWVYVDEQLIGCFALPATFPVLAEGSHQIKIRAGIKVNGIAATRSPYPFYNEYSQTIVLKRGSKITLIPTITYSSNTHFKLMEDFENSGTQIIKTANSDTTIQKIGNTNQFEEGAYSGIIYLDANRTFFECSTLDSFLLPKSGAPIFLEFNYKSNYNFTIGIIAKGTTSTSQFPSLSFNPSTNWNKAYLYLTPSVGGAYNALNYRIFIGMVNNTAADSVALLLDNLKLVY